MRARGVDVSRVQEEGLRGADDDVLVKKAHSEGRVILTQDRDFLRLHAAGVAHSGIVYTPQQSSVSRLISGALLVYEILSAEDMMGHIEFV